MQIQLKCSEALFLYNIKQLVVLLPSSRKLGQHCLRTTDQLTYCPDDGFLQLPLLMSFNDLGANVGAAVIRAGQLVVAAETQLPQQGVEHLQHSGACRTKQ